MKAEKFGKKIGEARRRVDSRLSKIPVFQNYGETEEEMTDLEITRLCAEAMGYKQAVPPGVHYSASAIHVKMVDNFGWERYDPLRDDEQAMALVKKFELNVGTVWEGEGKEKTWSASFAIRNAPTTWFYSDDLNRAICECVAKMRAGK